MFNETVNLAMEQRGVLAFLIIEEEENPEEISQSGVKGQKWGVRRTKKQLRSASKAGTSTGKLKKKASKMTNDELDKSIKRMSLEKKYVEIAAQANKKPPTRMSRGKTAVANIVKQSAASAAKAHTTNIMTKGMTTQIQKKYPKYELGKPKKPSSRSSS